jgi:hypothetical protein
MTFPSNHRADSRWASRLVRWGAVLLCAAVVVAAFLSLLGGPASATPGGGGPAVVPGAECVGQEGHHGTKDGKPYLCVQKQGEKCAHWHRVIVPGEPHGSWSPRPVGPCTQCSPSPSKSPSASPSLSPSASPSPSSPATTTAPATPPASSPEVPGGGGSSSGGSLPVTGAGVSLLVALAVLLVAVGVGLRRAGRRRTVQNTA